MLESFHVQRIAGCIDGLSQEVRALRYEIARHRDEMARHRDAVARHREKPGPQPEWLLILFFAGGIVLAVTLLIIAAVREGRVHEVETPRIEQQVELPDPATP